MFTPGTAPVECFKNIKDHNNRSGTNWQNSKWLDFVNVLLDDKLVFSGVEKRKTQLLCYGRNEENISHLWPTLCL